MNNEYENTAPEAGDDWTANELKFHSPVVGAKNLDAALAVAPAAPAVSASYVEEDWTMDMSTNEMPVPEIGGKWQMPEPVFRNSDGKKIEKSKLAAPPPSVSPTAPTEIAVTDAAPAAIQAQPYISEAFAIEDEYIIEEPPAAKSESGNKRIVLVVIGVLAMVLFAAAFLVGVYFLFFRNTGV